MEVAGINNTGPCFTYGQFYVAQKKKLFIYASEQKINKSSAQATFRTGR